MKRPFTSFLFAGLLASRLALAEPTPPANAVEQVDIALARPTQMEIGVAAVDSMQAEDQASLEPGETLEDRVLKRLTKSTPTAIRGPGGVLYITDGHHRMLEAYRLHAKNPAALAKVPVRIDADFSAPGKSAAFYEYMSSHSKGYFTPAVRARYADVVPESARFRVMFEQLPRDFGALARANNPARSVVGRVFRDIQVNRMSPPFVDYVEFLLAEKADCFLAARIGHESDADTLERARRALFKDPEMIDFLRSQAMPGQEAAAEKILARAVSEGEQLSGPEPAEWAECRPRSLRRLAGEAIASLGQAWKSFQTILGAAAVPCPEGVTPGSPDSPEAPADPRSP